MKKVIFLALALLIPGWADENSGPGRKTLVSEEWGTIFCQENCTVKSDPMGIRHRINSDKGPISLARSVDGWLLQAPNQNLRLRLVDGLDGGRRWVVSFNSAVYTFEQKRNDYSWRFPGDQVFFTLREGELRGALGSQGFYRMHKHNGGVSYQIESEAGTSEVLLGKKKTSGRNYRYVVVQQSGEELKRHPYLVRGVVFENGPVGIFIKMPRNPVLEALDWSQVWSVPSTVDYPAAKVVEPRPKNKDPLQAVEADQDPFGDKRNSFDKDRSMTDRPKDSSSSGNSTWSLPPK